MKVVACVPLHYGKENFAWSLRSIQEAVDEVHVFYTRSPSFGFSEGKPCPDSEEELRAQASRFFTKPLHWHYVDGVQHEGNHRDRFWHAAKSAGADLYLAIDSDEIWDTEALKQ